MTLGQGCRLTGRVIGGAVVLVGLYLLSPVLLVILGGLAILGMMED